MKSTQKKAFSRILGLLLMITLVIAIIPAIPGEAASKKSKAIAAYKKILSQSTVAVVPKKVRSRRRIRTYAPAKAKNVRFSVAYIDNDSIPELILVDSSKGFFGIWTFKNGKMMNLDFFLYDNPVGFYKKKGVFKTSHKSGNDFYKITNGKSKEILFISKDKGKSSKQYYSYNSKGRSKKISKSKFNKKKSFFGNYLFRNIDGAYKQEKSANMFDLYFRMLYEIDKNNRTQTSAYLINCCQQVTNSSQV